MRLHYMLHATRVAQSTQQTLSMPFREWQQVISTLLSFFNFFWPSRSSSYWKLLSVNACSMTMCSCYYVLYLCLHMIHFSCNHCNFLSHYTLLSVHCWVMLLLSGVAKKSRVLTPQEKKVVAYHEAGHALVGWLLKNTDTLMLVSHWIIDILMQLCICWNI